VLAGHHRPFEIGVERSVRGDVSVPGQDTLVEQVRQGTGAPELDGPADGVGEPGSVAGLCEQAQVDGRLDGRVCGAEPQPTGGELEVVDRLDAEIDGPRIIARHHGVGVQHHVATQMRAGGGVPRRELEPRRVRAQPQVAAQPPLGPRLGMVPHAETHTGQVRDDRDPEGSQVRGRTDDREQQQLGAHDGTRGQDHLPGIEAEGRPIRALGHDTRRARAFEADGADRGHGHHAQVGARPDLGCQEAARGPDA
jgi:hypothetical protein